METVYTFKIEFAPRFSMDVVDNDIQRMLLQSCTPKPSGKLGADVDCLLIDKEANSGSNLWEFYLITKTGSSRGFLRTTISEEITHESPDFVPRILRKHLYGSLYKHTENLAVI